MAIFIDHQKAFISLFNQTARYHKRHKVFEDFVSCSVIALENRLQFSEVTGHIVYVILRNRLQPEC